MTQEKRVPDTPVNALTRLFFILGSPIGHVKAPEVWSTLMRRYGVNALMLPADVSPSNFDAALTGIKLTENFDGAIFTMPHKVVAMNHVDVVTERAQRIGALNLMRRRADGRWEGDNVDGAGFLAGLQADGVNIDGANVHLNGCGGVGRCIAWTLAMENIASLNIHDIDRSRARELADSIAAVSAARVTTGLTSLAGVDIAINASPIGLQHSDPLPFSVEELPSHAVVCDVIMEPFLTALLASAQRRGLHVHHGRNMMNHAMPIAAEFFGLPSSFDWNGEAL
ncbi:shikimate dehydrogenase family protein [Cupriavidus gilardii]|uniref:Shikimate dehydrogenase n=1 Tax=Cupriavidus gilardii TaxID=82541 RepID=A0A849BAQ3_9BURK|nr:shikimate dehydrogenase [Cupriavidus gilardii]KAB0596110.1 shikimate dehydrogenase [Cupriavidus gilardii]MCT9014023.1 shikimate dehydrogenase [Cupriavidus gilardii]MCT9052211.1 shikimate dehydrogenase [Cupriavidus gilardii]NNH10953.1 shikimate dehydrogenase [Cupriavidus gilardii]WNG70544.1 shikimate dehydrogenase [Cupriavidus gilardii]